MSVFLLVALSVSVLFHFVLFYMLGKPAQVFLYNHKIMAAIAVLSTDFMMLIFIGAGNIVGISNLGGGLLLAFWIFVRGYFCKERVRITRVHWIVPKLVIERKAA